MDVNGASQNDGAQIIQHDCHGGKNQDFAVSFENGQLVLTAQHSNKVVSIEGAKKVNGANAQQQSNKNSSNQKYIVRPKGGNKYQLVSVNSNKCLDVYGGGKQNGARIIQVR